MDDLIRQSFADLSEDAETFAFLADDLEKKLKAASKSAEILADLKRSISEFISDPDMTSRIGRKRQITGMLRMLYSIIPAICLAADWQSPSYDSDAGRLTGKVLAGSTDYKRDHHADGMALEKAFLSRLVDAPFKLPMRAFTTVSGMAAFATICGFLRMYVKAGKIVAGKNTYFQALDTLKLVYGDNCIIAEENGIIEAIQKHEPAAVFLDTISSTARQAMPNIPAVIRVLEKYRDTYLILDNTVAGPVIQPFKRHSRANVIAWESLNKFHQYGMDRVTGGIIYGRAKNIASIFTVRKDLGTVLPDYNTLAIPMPKRNQLNNKIQRHERNTRYLANRLGIPYPGAGPFLVLTLDKKYPTVETYKRYTAHLAAACRKQIFPVVGGTSFGLNTTRLYVTAIYGKTTEPFIRLSPGTETLWEMERLAAILTESIGRR